jgi:hypothetical protein
VLVGKLVLDVCAEPSKSKLKTPITILFIFHIPFRTHGYGTLIFTAHCLRSTHIHMFKSNNNVVVVVVVVVLILMLTFLILLHNS